MKANDKKLDALLATFSPQEQARITSNVEKRARRYQASHPTRLTLSLLTFALATILAFEPAVPFWIPGILLLSFPFALYSAGKLIIRGEDGRR